MDAAFSSALSVSPEVKRSLELGLPVVALESTVITHGLPYPENIGLAGDMEVTVRNQGAQPATIAVLDGTVLVGLLADQLQRLAERQASGESMLKISQRDFAPAIARRLSGGVTVAGTMLVAHSVGIRVFATGGIGGVHHVLNPNRRGPVDISADLPALASIPMIVVCSGAKAILDLPATLEYLETFSIPVVGYQTDDFPAFYAPKAGNLKTSARADSPEEVVLMARAHWSLGLKSAILVVVPPPASVALREDLVKTVVTQALQEAREKKVRGQEVTPFLLDRVRVLTGGASLRANLGLLVNNAAVAGQIARALAGTLPGLRI